MLAPHPPTVNPPPSLPDLYRKYFEAIINKKRGNRRTKISDEAFVRNSRNCLLDLDVELVFSPPPKSSFQKNRFFKTSFQAFSIFRGRKKKKEKGKRTEFHFCIARYGKLIVSFIWKCLFVCFFDLVNPFSGIIQFREMMFR